MQVVGRRLDSEHYRLRDFLTRQNCEALRKRDSGRAATGHPPPHARLQSGYRLLLLAESGEERAVVLGAAREASALTSSRRS